MSGSAVLDTALGVAFVFLAASLVCSGVVEWVSNKLDKRGEYLVRGLREMLDIRPGTAAGALPADGLLERKHELPRVLAELAREPGESGQPGDGGDGGERRYLADLLLARPVVAGLHRPERPAEPGKAGPAGRFRWLRWWKRDLHLTSYLSAETFTRALFDLFAPDARGAAALTALEARVRDLPDGMPARESLLVLLREADGDLAAFRRSVEHWYDEQMGRVSGWYKRWSQWRLFIAGGVLAVVANVSTPAVAEALYTHEPLRSAVVAQSQAAGLCPDDDAGDLGCQRRQLDVLEDLTLPVGWDAGDVPADCRAANDGDACGVSPAAWATWAGDSLGAAGADGVLLRLLGWLVTAAAVAFGAPFWFDALGKLGSLRTAGRPPTPVPGS